MSIRQLIEALEAIESKAIASHHPVYVDFMGYAKTIKAIEWQNVIDNGEGRAPSILDAGTSARSSHKAIVISTTKQGE